MNIHLVDLIRACTCQPGTGQARLRSRRDFAEGVKVRPVKAAGRDALLGTHVQSRNLVFVVADRCLVAVVSGEALPDDRLIEAAAAVDLVALERVCKLRVKRP